MGRSASTIAWIFAVVCSRKGRGLPFHTPDLVAGPPGMLPEVCVAFLKITVYRRLSVVHRPVVAVVDDRASHATEDGFDHIEELGTCWKGRSLDDWTLTTLDGSIVLLDAIEEPL
jgi:hypothetical protein